MLCYNSCSVVHNIYKCYFAGELVDFGGVAFTDSMFITLLAISTFFVELQFLFLLHYNKTIAFMFATLKIAKKEVMAMAFITITVIIAFGLPQMIIIGRRREEYSTFPSVLVTFVSSALGKFHFNDGFNDAAFLLSKAFLMAYLLTSTFIVLNLFITLLNIFISLMKADKSIQPKDHEVIDYLLTQIKFFVTNKTVQSKVVGTYISNMAMRRAG